MPERKLKLWYKQPASNWPESLPVGNGRLGGMVYGGVEEEQIQLNEDTLWSGGPYSSVNSEAKKHLPEVRSLVLQGKFSVAQRLAQKHLLGTPVCMQAYQPAGNLFIHSEIVGEVTNYRRKLDIETAISSVSFTADGKHFMREVFCSAVEQVIVVRITCNKPASVNCRFELKSPHKFSLSNVDNDVLLLTGRCSSIGCLLI